MKMRITCALASVALLCGGLLFAETVDETPPVPFSPKVVRVTTTAELTAALRSLAPGTTVRIAPGNYSRGIFLRNVAGTAEAPIVITGEDPDDPPVFSGRGEGSKLSGCSYIKLSTMIFDGFTENGINIDDAGVRTVPSGHIIVENVTIRETGVRGNHDALKMSGVDHFVVRGCRFEAWGGSGIDMVGCHHGIIENCTFVGRAGCRQKNAVQMKGGSSDILVQTSFFDKVGERAVCIGGSTGEAFFRPGSVDYEAKDIIIAGNRFVGSEAPVAWITSRGSHVHHNIFYLPEKWVMRILQETGDKQFKPCGGGVFEYNLVVLDDAVKTILNAGVRTDPDSFTFRDNAWFRLDPDYRGGLQEPEADGVHQVDPGLTGEGTVEMKIGSRDLVFKDIGPDAYVPWRLTGDFRDISIPEIPNVPRRPPSIPLGRLLVYVLIGVAAAIALAIKVLRRPRSASGA